MVKKKDRVVVFPRSVTVRSVVLIFSVVSRMVFSRYFSKYLV